MGAYSPLKKNLLLPGKMCWTYFKIWPLSVNDSPLRLPWCPNLVRACLLCLLQLNNNVDFKN